MRYTTQLKLHLDKYLGTGDLNGDRDKKMLHYDFTTKDMRQELKNWLLPDSILLKKDFVIVIELYIHRNEENPKVFDLVEYSIGCNPSEMDDDDATYEYDGITATNKNKLLKEIFDVVENEARKNTNPQPA